MSKTTAQSSHQSGEDHGSVASYVTGFILSLVFTIIPYLLVVNKILTGRTLLYTILAIAVWQMIIQLVFFLHLGRGPKAFYNVVFFYATAGTILVVVGASLLIMDNLYRTMSPQEMLIRQSQEENIAQIGGKETGACKELRNSHIITISDSKLSPSNIQAGRCDTLTLVNEDSAAYEIAFGLHPDDSSYGGIDTITVGSARSETITLNEYGNFLFHDHSGANLNGSFLVSPALER